MKPLLARLGLPQAIGLYVDGDEVTVCHVVAGPLGPVEINRRAAHAPPERLASVLERIVTPMVGRKRLGRIPLAVGLPAAKVYFSTRPVQTADANPPPEVLLREALRSSSVQVDSMIVDVVKSQPDKRDVAGIVACEAPYLAALLRQLRQAGLCPQRVEPAPCGLLRLADARHPAGRHVNVVLRLFLNDSRGLAVLAAGGSPIIWRSFDLPRGDEASAIISACRSVLLLSQPCGIEHPLDGVMLHGRNDLMRLTDIDWIQEQLGAPLRWFDGPPLDPTQMALSLAVGCLKAQPRAFDLTRKLKPALSLRELFPFRELAVQAVLLVAMLAVLWHRSDESSRTFASAQIRGARHASLGSTDEAQLKKEKQELTQRVAAARTFLSDRIIWTAYARDLSAKMPPNVVLTSLHGTNELKSGGNKKGKQGPPKKSLVIQGTVSIDADGSIPHEIDRFLNNVREHPTLTKDFPIVELAGLKHFHGRSGESPMALFTILCLPKDPQSGG